MLFRSGVNNLVAGGDDAESTYEGIVAVTNEALKEFPNANIILFGLLPTAATPSKLTDYYNIQSKLKKCSFDKRVTYIDPTPYFTDCDGNPSKELFSGDMIHLQENGYKKWIEVINTTIKNL